MTGGASLSREDIKQRNRERYDRLINDLSTQKAAIAESLDTVDEDSPKAL